jgi:hypothetical protein
MIDPIAIKYMLQSTLGLEKDKTIGQNRGLVMIDPIAFTCCSQL